MLTPNYLFKGGEILPQRNMPFKSFLENLRKKLLLGKKSDHESVGEKPQTETERQRVQERVSVLLTPHAGGNEQKTESNIGVYLFPSLRLSLLCTSNTWGLEQSNESGTWSSL